MTAQGPVFARNDAAQRSSLPTAYLPTAASSGPQAQETDAPFEAAPPEAVAPEARTAESPTTPSPETNAPSEAPEPDGAVAEEQPSAALAQPPHAPHAADAPLPSSSDIAKRLRSNAQDLGTMSIGRPNSGALFNAVRMRDSAHWKIVDPGAAWGTAETITYLRRAIDAVHEQYPDTEKMRVGHLSSRRGGPLDPHRSHQSGRDVDVSYYYDSPEFRWYRRANAENLDRIRTWAFVRALITETDVEMIFINTSVQRLLKEHALDLGEDPQWLDSIFQVDSREPAPLIRHVAGHDTHIHVRFYNPRAQELGRRAYPHLVAHKHIKPRSYNVNYTVKRGDTLTGLAARFGTTVKAIKEANRIRGSKILAKRTYVIPKKGHVARAPRITVPARRLPPPAKPIGRRVKDDGATAMKRR